MTERYHDGFESYATGQSAATVEAMLSVGGWYIRRPHGATTPDVVSPGVYGFGNYLHFGGNSAGDYYLVHPLNAEAGITAVTGFIGVDVFFAANCLSPYCFIGFYDGVDDAPQVTIQFRPNGVLKMYRGYPSGGAVLDTSTIGAYLYDTWFRLELGVVIDAAAGSFHARVNTVPVLSYVTGNTKATSHAYFDSIAIGSQFDVSTTNINFSIDNLNINDDQGAQNNTYLGKVRVKSGLMVGAGSTTDFTPTGAASNWQAVGNLVRDDTKYVADGTVNDIDLYTPDPNLGSAPVRALQLRAAVRQDDATQRVYRSQFKISGTIYSTGRDHYLNQTYSDWFDMWELNPSSGVGMTGTDVNGSQMGPLVKV